MTKRMRVSVDLEGDLIIAFQQELGARVAKGSSSSKADLGRTLIAEALRAREYRVELPDTQWGGHTKKSEEALAADA